MPAKQENIFPSSDSGAQVLGCALDERGLREQRGRFARLAPGVARVTRDPEAVLFHFRAGFDRDALDTALAVESECCPFFRFELNEEDRLLRVTVQEPDQLPALDAIATAMASA